MNGIVVVDKPSDISSAGVVARVKKYFGAKKTGHAGTLDPFATGVLVCLINRATRLADLFLHAEKRYEATLCLGVATDTQDATGTVTATSDVVSSELTTNRINKAVLSFLGENEQKPPAFSAVKHKGQPLYKYARRGEVVEKPARKIFISSLTIDEINLPQVRFSVVCSAGTYIRTLCADIGEALGCGAHLKALRRTGASGFDISEAVTLEELDDCSVGCPGAGTIAGRLADRVIDMNAALRGMPELLADDVLAGYVRVGRLLTLADIVPPLGVDPQGGLFKVVDKTGDLLAVMKRVDTTYQYRCVFPDE